MAKPAITENPSSPIFFRPLVTAARANLSHGKEKIYETGFMWLFGDSAGGRRPADLVSFSLTYAR
jgi:hypothetical protein